MANNTIVPIALCFDERIVLGASATIKSLIDNAKTSTTYDIRILHSDLSLETQKNLTSLVNNTRHNLAFHYIDPEQFNNCPKSKGSWTEIVYYRILIPDIIKEYEKVIYSDVDVLFKGDLAELYNTNIEGYELGAVRAELNTPNTIGHKYFPENKNEFIYWSGLMILNCKKFREDNLIDTLISNAKLFNKRLKFFDLDLINITCNNIKPVGFRYCVLQDFYYNDDYTKSKDYEYLSKIYSNEDLDNEIKNCIIVHYAGKLGKPWRRKYIPKDYKDCINSLPKKLVKYTFRDIRKKLFNKV